MLDNLTDVEIVLVHFGCMKALLNQHILNYNFNLMLSHNNGNLSRQWTLYKNSVGFELYDEHPVCDNT